MATKALKITSEINNPTTGVATSDLVVAFSGGGPVQNNRGITSNYESTVEYYLTETELDDPTCTPLRWTSFSNRESFAVTEADWDDNTKSPNDMLYDKLKTALEAAGHTVTILTKS